MPSGIARFMRSFYITNVSGAYNYIVDKEWELEICVLFLVKG